MLKMHRLHLAVLLFTSIISKFIHQCFILIMFNSNEVTPTTISTSSSSSSSSSKVSVSCTATNTTENKIKHILNKINQWKQIHLESDRNQHLPFVSVTYAQSLDGMIAIQSNNSSVDEKDNNNFTTNKINQVSSNLQLSCKETFQLTHALRSIHDGVLIGGNTLLHDNPRLNNRLWNDCEIDESQVMGKTEIDSMQPVPIILDTNLKYLLQMMKCNVTMRAMSSHDKVIICCCEDSYIRYYEEIQSRYEYHTIHLLKCKLSDGEYGRLNLKSVLENLRSIHDIKSVMVEGGSSILSCFMEQAEHVVNCVCVTIVPKMIGGSNGLLSMQNCNLVQQDESKLGGFEFNPDDTSWSTIGSDCVFLASCGHNSNKPI